MLLHGSSPCGGLHAHTTGRHQPQPPSSVRQHRVLAAGGLHRAHRRSSLATASSASFSSSGDGDATPEQGQPDYTPFARLKERNPYRLLGLSKDASFEEVQDARNFLFEQYRWHEPSRESIELAFEAILKDTFKARTKFGFRPPRTGRGTDARGEPAPWTLERRFRNLFDPTISTTAMINEGAVYVGLALWTLFSSDQSFPLAGAFAYSVYRFQSKRIKNNPEGPFFGGNAIVGALITTTINIGIACAVMTVLSAPLASLLDSSLRQVGGCFVILIAGALGLFLK